MFQEIENFKNQNNKNTFINATSKSTCYNLSLSTNENFYNEKYGLFVKTFFLNDEMIKHIKNLIKSKPLYKKDFFHIQNYAMLLFCVLNGQRGELIKKLTINQFLNRDLKYLNDDKKNNFDKYTNYISIHFPNNKTCNLNQFVGCTSFLEKIILKLIQFRFFLFKEIKNDYLFINMNKNKIIDLNKIWLKYIKYNFNQKSPISSFHKIRHIIVSTSIKHNINLNKSFNDLIKSKNMKKISVAMGHSAKQALKSYVYDETKQKLHYESWCLLRILQKIS